MRRLIPCALAVVLLCSCPPTRGGGDDEEGEGASSAAIWLVLTSLSDGSEESVTHNFMRSNRSGLCNSIRQYYERYVQAMSDYYSDYEDFRQEWGDDYDYDDPAYRLAYCELYRDYYQGYANAYAALGDGLDLLSLSPGDGAPEAGDYSAGGSSYGDDDSTGYGEGTLYGSRTIYHDNYYQFYVDAFDCQAYAADPDADMYPDDIDTEGAYESFYLVEGVLTVSEATSSAWDLVLSGGRMEDDEGELSDYEVDDTFTRCDVSYEYPDYYYYDR